MTREDIDVTTIEITDSFRFEGRTYKGLNDLRKTVVRNKDDLMETYPPFVVLIQKSYPCFDSSDSMYENRSYQAYFLTTDRVKAALIIEESRLSDWEFSQKGIERLYPVMEPMFCMSKIQEHHLPYIYYHGDGDTMEIVQDRNAEEQVDVIPRPSSRWSFFRDPDPDPTPCLYGPPTDIDRYAPTPFSDKTDDSEIMINFD